jgi:hypothetical protein
MSYVYPSVTDEAYDAAFERLIPYVEGYPYPMIDILLPWHESIVSQTLACCLVSDTTT